MKVRSFALALSFIPVPSLAFAAQTNCPQYHFGGQAPDLLNEKLATKTQQICCSGYSLIHSGVTRTPLTSAEHLTRERVAAPRPERQNTFHADPNIPPADRAELQDYTRSGYDRGHMAPSEDMASEKSQYESFSLANMIPQDCGPAEFSCGEVGFGGFA